MKSNELETLCADWPGVSSSVKWDDDLVLSVAGKMFAVYCLRGPHRERISFKVDRERFLELTDQPGITPAAYMARAFWVTIAEPDRFARMKISEFLRHSYELVRAGLSKKQQAALGVVVPASAPTVPAAVAQTPAKKKPVKKAATKNVAVKKAPVKKAAKSKAPAKRAKIKKV
jgi:predicted DNA-binding protein (MmcQ/YjbR family)